MLNLKLKKNIVAAKKVQRATCIENLLHIRASVTHAFAHATISHIVCNWLLPELVA